MENKTKLTEENLNVDRFPGAAIDVDDKEKVDKSLVEERTKTLNDNPRNQGDPV